MHPPHTCGRIWAVGGEAFLRSTQHLKHARKGQRDGQRAKECHGMGELGGDAAFLIIAETIKSLVEPHIVESCRGTI